MKFMTIFVSMFIGITAAQAATISEICTEHTASRKSLNVCLENAADVPHLAACADATLNADNTFKTVPFKKCLEIGQKRNLSVQRVQNCELNSATHLGFMNCLKNADESNRLAESAETN